MNCFQVALILTLTVAGGSFLSSILTDDINRKLSLTTVSTIAMSCVLTLIVSEIVTMFV